MAPGEGNLDPTGPQLLAGWVPTLRYTSLGGATHTSSVTEVAEWVQTLAPSDRSSPVRSSPVRSSPVQSGLVQSGPVQSIRVRSVPVRSGPFRSGPVRLGPVRYGPVRYGPVQSVTVRSGRPVRSSPVHSGPVQSSRSSPVRRSPRLRPLAASASALTTPPPVYYPAPSDLNLDRAGQPRFFASATRGPHGKEWALADEQELIKLLVLRLRHPWAAWQGVGACGRTGAHQAYSGNPQAPPSCHPPSQDPHRS